MTTQEHPGCPDCPAVADIRAGSGIFGSIELVRVIHDLNCPWAARNVPPNEPLMLPTEDGLTMHVAGGLDQPS